MPAAQQARVREATLKVLGLLAVRDRLLELGFEVGAVLQSIGFKPE